MLQKTFNSVHSEQGVKKEKKKSGHIILNISLPQTIQKIPYKYGQ
jgi:hypothetical protein